MPVSYYGEGILKHVTQLLKRHCHLAYVFVRGNLHPFNPCYSLAAPSVTAGTRIYSVSWCWPVRGDTPLIK